MGAAACPPSLLTVPLSSLCRLRRTGEAGGYALYKNNCLKCLKLEVPKVNAFCLFYNEGFLKFCSFWLEAVNSNE